MEIVFLVILLGVLNKTGRPMLCTLIYTIAWVVYAAINMLLHETQFATALLVLAVVGAVRFILAGIYFWLLNFLENGLWWWVAMVAGICFVFIVPLLLQEVLQKN